jgi:hypothetical protein
MKILLAVSLSAAAVALAQPKASLSLPVMGLISGGGPAEVRALVGLPGSATTGDAMKLPGVRRVHLAPGQEAAVVERIGSPIGVLAFEGASAGQVSDIAGAMSGVELVGFSPSGNYTVLYSAQAARVQVIALNGGAGRVAKEFAAQLSAIRQVAIDDAGESVVAVTDDGGVYRLGNGSPQQIFRGSTITDITFVTGFSSLLVAEADAGRVTLVSDVPDKAAARVVGMGMDNDGQLWVRSSTDSKYVFAAGSGRRTAWRAELASGDVRSVSLPEDAVELTRLGSGNTFVYSSATGPVWLLLGDDPELRTVFVPGPDVVRKRGVAK